MRFALTDEQEALRGIARAFLTELPGGRSLLDRPHGHDPATWSRVVEDQGWQAIALPEEAGGFGLGLVDLTVVAEELGRALVPTPLLATIGLAAPALVGRDELAGLAEGRTATVALDGPVRAARRGDAWHLAGHKVRVLDGHTAETVLVATDAGLFVVPGAALDRAPTPGLDPLRPLARLEVDLVVPEADRLPVDALALAPAWVLLAADCLGVAAAALDLAVDYAKVRRQFGKPIGAFQAIQHKCADMLVAVESARSAVMYAAWALDADAPDRTLAAHTAKAIAADAAVRCAGECIQIHGGIGFTWEHDAHLLFKRARAAEALLGSGQAHRAAVADALL